ncbi:uncharacterized protein LOC102802113 [Saccoglossus kowalevskii]|uniref:Uncharacterized protein LOC102802113 n=1 Tax=Saccoglossus kowalevskii TaxID=10224 RepID=A0ABM0MJ15_SACKO|nr:PREDICTED: uncharacterized protein LOC102802113 [Saccoglossus kowalevskii]
MPSNDYFKFHVLVEGDAIPEYTKDGQAYVESDLFTSSSYMTQTVEEVHNELEVQQWPVTPYQVEITSADFAPDRLFRLFVDGKLVVSKVLGNGRSCLIKGFRVGNTIKEFLFSLPCYMINEHISDLPNPEKVGFIIVECCNISYGSPSHSYTKPFQYNQATKKDVHMITNGNYTLVTTKVGKEVESWTVNPNRQSYGRIIAGDILSTLSVKYMISHDLIEMGIHLQDENANMEDEMDRYADVQTDFEADLIVPQHTKLKPKVIDLHVVVPAYCLTDVQTRIKREVFTITEPQPASESEVKSEARMEDMEVEEMTIEIPGVPDIDVIVID